MSSTARRTPPLPDYLRKNRRLWESISDAYERRHRRSLSGAGATKWGLWRIPESELQVLGDVRGLSVLELGCGAARWSIALRRAGARAVGLDLSRRHLRHAQQEMRAARTRLPLVEASAESIPFRSNTFDIVFCDWGAMTFGDPLRTVPESSRVLRAGGLLAFTTASPFRDVCTDRRRDRIGTRLRDDYFSLHRVDFPDEVNFQLPYGRWIRLFTENGFEVQRLEEPRAPLRARTSYLARRDLAWGSRWPLECLWVVRKKRGAARGGAPRRART